MNFILKNARIIALNSPKVEEADLRIVDDTIAERGKNLRSKKSEEVIDLSGNIYCRVWLTRTHTYTRHFRAVCLHRNLHHVILSKSFKNMVEVRSSTR